MEQESWSRPGINEKSGLFILIALMGAGFVVAGGLSVFLWKAMTGQDMASMQQSLANPAYAMQVRIIQTLASFVIFFLPALVTARVMTSKPLDYIGFSVRPTFKKTSLAVVIMLVSILLGGALATLNEMIPLSENLRLYFTEMENNYLKQVDVMSQMKNTGDLLLSVVVMALVPAVVEESFFRGGFQNMMYRATHQVWVSVIVTSLLFSAIHFSFFGFLTRTVLGIVLGLLYAYGKNLWLPILAHFINNAIGVFQLYFLRMKGEPIASGMEDKYPLWWSIPALAALYFLFRIYRIERQSAA